MSKEMSSPHKDSQVTIEVTRHNGYTVVSCTQKCSLDAVNAQQFKQQVLANYRPGDTMILDFKKIAFLDSSALSVLINIRKEILKSRGSLKLANVGPSIQKLFQITRLHRVFEVYESLDAAIEALEGDTIQETGHPPYGIHLQVIHRSSYSLVRIKQPDSLIAANCRHFRDKIQEYLQQRDAVVLNLDVLRNIDSAGVSSLIHLKRYAQEHRKHVVLVCTNRILTRLLKLYSLDRLFPVFGDEGEAIRAVSKLLSKGEVSAAESEKSPAGAFEDVSFLSTRKK
jgi:anti-sigma B factor antagonist